MKRRSRHANLRIAVLAALAPGASLWAANVVSSMREPSGATRIATQTRPVCVGRFLIDMPSDATVTRQHVMVDHFRVTNHGSETEEQFLARLMRREAAINAVKNQAGTTNMERVDDIHGDGASGKVFVFGRTATHVYHGEKRVDYVGVEVNGYVNVNGTTFSFISNDYDPEHTGNLARLMSQLQPVGPEAIPTQPGFCLDGVFLRDSLRDLPRPEQGESIVMFAGLPGHEDLGIALSTIAGTAPGPGLIERTDANRVGPYAFLNLFTSTLLKGSRTINGLEGEELAIKVREHNLTTGYAFDWETRGTGDNVLRPFVSLELQTGISPHADGAPRQSSLSEASLGDVWRRMSSSLRLHSVAVSPAPAPPH